MIEIPEEEIEATDEQLTALREFGVDEREIAGISMAEAEAILAELRAEREVGR